MYKEADNNASMLTFVAVVKKNQSNWSGFFPDLPGTAATGGDKEKLTARLSEVLALHLLDMREDAEDIPAPTDYSEDELSRRYPNSEKVWIVEADINPISLEIGRVIAETGKSLRDLEKDTGISYSVLSRLQDPFYWGHSLKSLISFSEAFHKKIRFSLEAA